MTTKELLGARIKELRKKKGLTQDKLSEMIDIDPKHLSRIEVGRGYPSLETLNKMSTVLKVDLKDFFEFHHQVKNVREIEKQVKSLLSEASPEMMSLILKIIRALVK